MINSVACNFSKFVCSECGHSLTASSGSMWPTDTPGTYQFLCYKCERKIYAESMEFEGF